MCKNIVICMHFKTLTYQLQPSSTGRYDLRPRRTPDRYKDKFDESPIEFGKKIKALERDSVTKSIKTISFNKTRKA